MFIKILTELLKLLLLGFWVFIVFCILWFSPIWYELIKDWHRTHICEVDTDCFETNVTPNMCTNESWINYYSNTKGYEKIIKNFHSCQCSDYLVTNICTKKIKNFSKTNKIFLKNRIFREFFLMRKIAIIKRISIFGLF